MRIDPRGMRFEEEAALEFDVRPGDEVTLGLAYEYREQDAGKETARIRLVAQLAGQKEETFEAVIHDNPLVDDSRRGYLSVPVRAAGAGALKGRFRIEADYESGAWTERAPDRAASMRHEGEFVLRVS